MKTAGHLTLSLAIAAGVAFASSAFAGEYRWETGGQYQRFSVDGFDANYWSLYGTYFFRDVKTDALPLQEAAYLGRASSLSLAPARFDSDAGTFDQWRISSDVYVPGTWLYLSAGVTRADSIEPTYNGTSIVPQRGQGTTWDGAIGITPFDGLRLSTSFYQHGGYQPNLDMKYVGRLGNDHFYGFGVNLLDPDGGDFTYGLTADYFIDRTLRVGTEVGKGFNLWGVSADKFFWDHASVGLSYINLKAGDQLGLRAAWRF
jgi:hypothetical protein